MRIAAFDPGTHLGYCVLNSTTDEIIALGTMDLSPRRHEGGGMRYLRFRAQLIELLEGGSPEVVAYEEVRRHAGTDAAHVYGGLVAVLVAECEARGIPYAAYPVGTVKKVATGKGNADKDAMIEAAQARWPGFQGDDNAADAAFIAVTAARALNQETRPKGQRGEA